MNTTLDLLFVLSFVVPALSVCIFASPVTPTGIIFNPITQSSHQIRNARVFVGDNTPRVYDAASTHARVKWVHFE